MKSNIEKLGLMVGLALGFLFCDVCVTDAQPALPLPSSQTAAYDTNGVMKWPTNFFLRNMGIVDVTDAWIGAKLDGATDDQAALQKAADYGGLIFVPYTTNGCLVGASVLVKSNNFWTACGGKTRFIMKQSFSSGYVFDTGTNSNISFNGIEVDGSSNVTFIALGVGGTRSGMSLYARGNILVTGCDIHGFSNNGILITSPVATSDTSLVLTNHNVSLRGTTVTRCGIGINFDVNKAEYTGGADLTVLECSLGVNIDCGNVNIGGKSQICMNNIGVNVGSSANNGHGSVVGALLNHNNFPIFCNGTTLGFVFSGCQIFTGTILISGATGIQIVNGEIDVAAITFQSGGSQNVISGNFCFNGNANAITNPNLGWIYNNPKNGGGWLGTPGWYGFGGNLIQNDGFAQIGTNTTDQVYFGGQSASNGLIRMVGGDAPRFELLAGNSNCNARLNYALVSNHKVANYQILMTESGSVFDNKGATIITTNGLPNNPTNGFHCTVLSQTNAGGIWVQATNAFIRYGPQVTTNSGFVSWTNAWASAHFFAVSSNEWIIDAVTLTNGVPVVKFQ